MNKVILMGRLTKDPELRRTNTSGIPVVSFTLAVDRRFKSQNGERETDFISLIAWRQQAEFVAKYLHQGSKICVVGTLQTRSYEKNGEKRYVTEVVVEEVYFAESKILAYLNFQSMLNQAGALTLDSEFFLQFTPLALLVIAVCLLIALMSFKQRDF